MKGLWVPNGVANFAGTYIDLLHTISSVDGTLDDENTFHCQMAFPPRNHDGFSFVVVRGRIRFSFRCSITQKEDYCLINYRVYPSFFTAICLLLPIVIVFLRSLFTDTSEIISSIVTIGVICGVLISLFLWARRSCVRQFVRKFEREEERFFS